MNHKKELFRGLWVESRVLVKHRFGSFGFEAHLFESVLARHCEL